MEAWRQFILEAKKELGSEAIEHWIGDLKISRFDAGNLYLEARDSFQVSWFEEQIRPLLRKGLLLNNNQRQIKVHISVAGSPKKEDLKKPEEKRQEEKRQEEPARLSIRPDPLDPHLSLEHFIPSSENLMAYKLMGELTHSVPFNPIYLYGPKSSGKTHLLMGAAQALHKQGKRVFFVRAETFTHHVVQAIRLGHMQEFRKTYRDIDALIIDDIHIFSKKSATQEEFFHTFNNLHTLGRPILLSANAAPSFLKEIEPRLISRFEWGISVGMEKTDPKPLIEKKASLWNVRLSPEMIQFFLNRFSDPLFALQALVLRAKGAGHFTPEIAERLLKDLLESEQKNALTFEDIIKLIAAYYGIRSEDLLGKSQTREFAAPRQLSMYVCREKLKLPYQKIGELFSRDHSTVMSSVKQIQKAIEEKSPDILNALATL